MNTRKRRKTKRSALTILAIIGLVSVFECLPVRGQEVTTLVQFTSMWKYDQSGLELGTAWRTNDFDDSAWASGKGLLGSEDVFTPYSSHAPLLTPLTVSPAVTTYYFRTTFQWTGSIEGLSLFATNLVDDGCVIYLNGLQVGGVRMPASFNAATFFGFGTEGQLEVVTLSGVSALRQGENLLAVEVHQATSPSSDIMFGMKLMAVHESPLALTSQPESLIVSVGDTVSLRVGVSGGPATYRWVKDDINLPNGTTSTYLLTNLQPSQSGNYRVIITNSINAVTSSVATLTVMPDRSGPQVLRAIANNSTPVAGYGLNSINVFFSELMIPSPANGIFSVRNANNYTITQLGTINSVGVTQVLYSTQLGAILYPNTQDPDWVPYGDYMLTINNVTDLKGHVIAPNFSVPLAWRYSTNLIHPGQTWDFHASAILEPDVYDQSWFACDYVTGPTWGRGFAPLYGGTMVQPPCPVLGAPQTSTGWQPEPMLYRATFTYPDHWPSNATLRIRAAFDDGLVIFLNGTEIYRNNVINAPGSPIHVDSRSLTAPNQVSCVTNITIDVTNLKAGTNCLAAAVLQGISVNGDDDSYFALEMEASAIFTPELPPEPLPVLQTTSVDTNAVRLSWTGNGYALESSTNLNLSPASYPVGTWIQVPRMSNPYLWTFTNDSPRFFRLKK